MINDTIYIVFDTKREKYIFHQGRETFYDPVTRELIELTELKDALDYAQDHFPDNVKIVTDSEDYEDRIREKIDDEPPPGQLSFRI